ncbi:MAG: peptidase, partial [Pseudomonadota bacterium]|nr:peptidase [Pseudomonadota bacterium]
MQQQQYPIGVPGQPWGESEKKEWLQQQRVQRSYEADVISQIERFKARFDVREYGQLEYASQRYPLYAVLS